MRKGIGKRILAVFLAVFMVFTVLPIQALAGEIQWNSSVKIKEATFGWSSDGEPIASVKYETPDGQLGEDICLLEPCVPGLPKKDLPIVELDGSKYYLCSYHTINNENPSQYQVNLDGTTTVTANPLSLFTGVSLTEGTTMGLCVEIQKGETYSTSESVYTDVFTFTVPKNEEEWTLTFNEEKHWEVCTKGAHQGDKRNEGEHSYSSEDKTFTVSHIMYDPRKPLSSANTPLLTDAEDKSYIFNGNGFVQFGSDVVPEESGKTYYANSFEGTSFHNYSVKGSPCGTCSYVKFTGAVSVGGNGFTASLEKPVAPAGDTVNLSLEINAGVEVAVSAKDGAGNDVAVSKKIEYQAAAGDAVPTTYTKNYYFTQPANNVIISLVPTATLTYDANNGQGDVPEKQTVTPGTSVEVASANLSKDGSSFVYWNTEPDGSGDTYYIGDSITVSANTTLYAQYGGILFIDVPPDYVTSIGEPFILIDLSDYGWEGSDFYVYGLPAAVGDDLTEAKTAIENAEINVDVNNVELSGWTYLDVGSGSTLDSLPAAMPQTILIVAVPTFVLTGSFAVGDTITVPPTMAAIYWENDWDFDEDWKFELDAGEYTLEYVGYNPVDPDYPEDPDYHSFKIVDKKDEDNYHYLELKANGNTDKPWGVTCIDGIGTGNDPYLFEVVPGVTVTYDGNGATSGEAPVDANTYKAGDAVVTLTHGTLDKAGYTFKEWNTKPDGSGESYAENSTFTITGTTTLYAQWTVKSSGGSDTPAPSTDDKSRIAPYIPNILPTPSTVNTTTTTDTTGSTDKTPVKDDKDTDSVDGAGAAIHDPDNVIERTAEAEEGDVITVKMPADDTVLPKKALENIMGKNITLVIKLPGSPEITWTIKGKDVTAPKDVDLGITTMNNEQIGVVAADLGIPVEVINLITGEKEILYMHLNHDGDFGFIATLKVNLKNAGMYANLFYLTENATMPEFLDSCVIDKDGCAEFRFTHASDYFILIDDKPFDAEITEVDDTEAIITDDTVPGTTTTPTEVVAPAADSNPTTGVALCGTAVLAAGAAALAAAFAKKRKNK